jgi:pyruvate dehydrogenase E1 component alpha subunit
MYDQAVVDDPVPKLRQRLIAESILAETAVVAMEAEIAAELEEAIAFALASPMPDPSEVMIDIYADKVEFA